MRLFLCWRLCCPTCFFFCRNDSRTDFFFLRASATGCNSYFCSNAFRTSDFLRMRLLFLCWALCSPTCFFFCWSEIFENEIFLVLEAVLSNLFFSARATSSSGGLLILASSAGGLLILSANLSRGMSDLFSGWESPDSVKSSTSSLRILRKLLLSYHLHELFVYVHIWTSLLFLSILPLLF